MIKALQILNGYQASVIIVVDKMYCCPDGVSRRVTNIQPTVVDGKYHITCDMELELTVIATNVVEQY